MNVAVLGASDNPQRYSYKAVEMLKAKKHRVFPINPKLDVLLGEKTYVSLSDILEPLDTVSVYVSATVSSGLKEQLLSVKPRRVIFNPGAENPDLEKALIGAGILAPEACTLVMLTTGQF